MRRAVALLALLTATQLNAQDLAIASAVYLERAGDGGALQVEPATRLLSGDRVVTILRWDAPRGASYSVVSAVPERLAIESTSEPLEVSGDGGRTWRALADPRAVPPGTTHLRWQVAGGEGRLSYRAVVR